jgi:hypothetical protein
MCNAKFRELGTLCKQVNLRLIGIRNFSIMSFILWNKKIGDFSTSKKYFLVSLTDNRIEIVVHSNLLIKRSNFYDRIIQTVKRDPFEKITMILYHDKPRIREIFTFKIYCLIKRIMARVAIEDVTKIINTTYIMLVMRDMIKIYNNVDL